MNVTSNAALLRLHTNQYIRILIHLTTETK